MSRLTPELEQRVAEAIENMNSNASLVEQDRACSAEESADCYAEAARDEATIREVLAIAGQRCETCKHWDDASNNMHGPHSGPVSGWGECTAIGQHIDPGPIPDDDLATLSDGSGYFAALATRPTFGCALWEGRE